MTEKSTPGNPPPRTGRWQILHARSATLFSEVPPNTDTKFEEARGASFSGGDSSTARKQRDREVWSPLGNTEVVSGLKSKLKMAESKVAALGKEMRAVKREHAEQVKPLRALIDVLREQVAASNEERDKAVAAAKSKGGPPVHQGKEQLDGLLNEENLRLMNVPQQQRFQGEQRDPTSARAYL